MTIVAAVNTAHALFLSTVTIDTERPSDAAIAAARQRLDGETLAQWSPSWQKNITHAREMIADCA
jgi:hypothetical protein